MKCLEDIMKSILYIPPKLCAYYYVYYNMEKVSYQ